MLEKRADASDTSVVFFPFTVLIFCLLILFLLKLHKMPDKKAIVLTIIQQTNWAKEIKNPV